MHLTIFASISSQLVPSPIDDLVKAKQQLEAGRKQLVDGKLSLFNGTPEEKNAQGVVVKPATQGAYAQLKGAIGAMNSGIVEAQKPLDQLNSVKSIISNVIKVGLPTAIAITLPFTLVPPFIGTVLMAALTPITINTNKVPAMLDGVANSLQSMINPLRNVSGVISPTVEANLNMDNPQKPDVYVKFEAADKKFGDAIAKIDQIVTKLKAIEEALE